MHKQLIASSSTMLLSKQYKQLCCCVQCGVLQNYFRGFSSDKMDREPHIEGIIDSLTPTGTVLSAQYKQSFAYMTFTRRIPNILDLTIDTIQNDKRKLIEQFGERPAGEELETVIGKLKQLKADLRRNKILEPLTDEEPDTGPWNEFLMYLPGQKRTFFQACWLYAECYIYRRISSFFKASISLKDYDYFHKEKENAMTTSEEVICAIVRATRQTDKSDQTLIKLAKVNLWGNRCDLSLSAGRNVQICSSPMDELSQLDSHILVDNSGQLWGCLNTANAAQQVVDIVCDNSGFELFTDFILAEYLLDKNLAGKVRFHVKTIPWYISDVTPRDFHWALDYFMNNQKSKSVQDFGQKLFDYYQRGRIELAPPEFYWTSPYPFYCMREVNPELYELLSSSQLVIFKGDLNYRKLLGDFNWNYTESFIRCINDFRPTNVCAFRTVKADVICGMQTEQIERLQPSHPKWMLTGEYGLIQFAPRRAKFFD